MWPFRKSLARIAEGASDRELVTAVHDRSPRKIDEFSGVQRGVHAAWWLKAEIGNGGGEQYFSNSTADDYPLLCQFLEEIQASETLDALTSFGKRFGSPDESFPERSKRIELVAGQEETRGDEWEAVVSAATERIRSTFSSLTTKLAQHIRENLETTEG